MSINQATRLDSKDTRVFKYIFEFGGDRSPAIAEAVLYRYPTFENRTVICCSTQSGCPIGCSFCGTGKSFVRSLGHDEIIAQVEHIFHDHKIDTTVVKKLQIMFMSMGEPMLNFKELEKAIRTLHGKFPNASLLISTSAPNTDYSRLRDLSCEIPSVGLQFSVHESTDEARNILIPFRHKLSLSMIAYEGTLWYQATERHPFFNYCVHTRNNTEADADRLTTFFNPSIWEATLSVICESDETVSAAHKRQRELVADFMELLLVRNFSVRMFDPAGQDDIGGGCGQLWHVQKWMQTHPELVRKQITA